MTPTLWRFGWRSLIRHPLLTGLSVLGIALGIAVVVAMDLASQSARRAFGLSAEAVSGRATHSIMGGPSGLDDSLYRHLRVELGIQSAAPVVEGFVRPSKSPGHTLRILGLDFLAERTLRPRLGNGSVDVRTLITTPGAVLLAATTAAELRIEPTSLCECIATLSTVTFPESTLRDSVPASVRCASASVVTVSG